MPIAPDGTPLPYPAGPTMGGAPLGIEDDELAGEYGDIDDAPAGASPMLAQVLGAPPPDEATNALPMDEGALFEDVLSGIRELIEGGTLSEKNKLLLEKASTLVQQIRADAEKDRDKAMGMSASNKFLRQTYGATYPPAA